MALGTNLAIDLESAFTVSGNRTALQVATDIATAIDNYLIGAVYAGGAIIYTSNCAPNDFLLPLPGTIEQAADKWSTAVDNYFNGTPTPGSPISPGMLVVSPVPAPLINHILLKTTLDTNLQSIFNIGSGNPSASTQAGLIAGAIISAIMTIITVHTETTPTPPSSIVVTTPYLGIPPVQ